MESGLLDSMGIMSLVTHLEQTYSFALPDEEFVPENFETPSTIANMVKRVTAVRK
jgi:acyl carrier protein